MDKRLASANSIRVIVKPASGHNEIESYSAEKKAWLIKIDAAAEKNKANIELLRFLKKQTGTFWIIKTGLHSREKILVRKN